MRRFFVMIATILVLTAGLFGLVGCKGPEIVFVVGNEEYARTASTAPEMPEDPEMEGMDFAGWFYDPGIWEDPLTLQSLTTATLKESISVYAHFVEKDKDIGQVTLTFNSMGGTDVAAQTMMNGSKPKVPANPTYDGYYFCGWYQFPDYVTPFSFEEAITENMTVYAKWAQEGSTNLASVDFKAPLKTVEERAFHAIYEADGKTYLVYKLGTMKNVILGHMTDIIYHVAGTSSSLNTSQAKGREDSVTKTAEYTLGQSASVSLEVNVGLDLPFANPGLSISGSYSREESWTEGISNTQTFYSQQGHGKEIVLDHYEGNLYYGIFAFGTQEIYQYFVYEGDEWTGKSGLTLKNVGNVTYRALSSEDGDFTYPEDAYLEAMEAPDLSLLFDGGAGTSASPYRIFNPLQLYAVRFDMDATYKMMADVKLADISWKPIGGERAGELVPFLGSFDGNGHAISKLNLAYGVDTSFAQETHIGLFGSVTGTVKNLTLKEFSVTIPANHALGGWAFVGALCGNANGATLENIKLENINLDVNRDLSLSGALVGRMVNGKAKSITVNDSTIFANGDIGMVMGSARDGAVVSGCTVSNSHVKYYAVYNNRCVGGVVGYLNGATIEKCTVTGTEFCFAGSDNNGLHNYFLWAHSWCALRPSMGFLVGGSSGASVLDLRGCKQEGNTKTFTSSSDDEKKITGNYNESKSYFKAYSGMVGFVYDNPTVYQ